jgi:hypothetical protein
MMELDRVVHDPSVINAVETAGEQRSPAGHSYMRDGIFTSERGLRLKLKKVSRMVVVEAGMKIDLPSPPKVWIPEQERFEDNVLDPDYEDSLRRAQYNKSIASTSIYLAMGTEIIKPLPEDMADPDDDSWSDELDEMGVTVPDKSKRRMRYVFWLRCYALNDDDFTELSKATAHYSGHLTEQQVQDIENSFRNQSTGDANTGSSSTP